MEINDVVLVMTKEGELTPAYIIIENIFKSKDFKFDKELTIVEKLFYVYYPTTFHLVKIQETGEQKIITDEEIFKARPFDIANWKKYRKIL